MPTECARGCLLLMSVTATTLAGALPSASDPSSSSDALPAWQSPPGPDCRSPSSADRLIDALAAASSSSSSSSRHTAGTAVNNNRNRTANTEPWVMPLHVTDYLCGRDPKDYRARVADCGASVSFDGRGLGTHSAECKASDKGGSAVFCACLGSYLRAYPLPTRRRGVTLGFNVGDFVDLGKKNGGWPCLGFSAPRWAAHSTFLSWDEFLHALDVPNCAKPLPVGAGHLTTASPAYAALVRAAAAAKRTGIPWRRRSAVPVWRGSLWWTHAASQASLSGGPVEALIDAERRSYHAKRRAAIDRAKREGSANPPLLTDVPFSRAVAVLHSLRHPEHLDARATLPNPWELNHAVWRSNATNGVHALLTEKRIHASAYHGSYQVALVLGGIGAAFRLTETLRSGTAVVLEDVLHELWYTRFLRPYVHFVPLAHGAGNLTDALAWVRGNPEQVERIARRGRMFYEANLSPTAMERNFEHLASRVEKFLAGA